MALTLIASAVTYSLGVSYSSDYPLPDHSSRLLVLWRGILETTYLWTAVVTTEDDDVKGGHDEGGEKEKRDVNWR